MGLAEWIQKDEEHFALAINFKGQNVLLNLYEASVKQELVFRKGLIEQGIYSELVYKIRNNFSLLVLSNYR